MTMTSTVPAPPRQARLDRDHAMQLAATEYSRFVDVLRGLSPQDWLRPTDCPAWDVRAMVAHNLGMAELSASVREQRRQTKTAGQRAAANHTVYIDELTGLQVDKHAADSPADLVREYAVVGPKAARGRRRTPGFIRRRSMPVPQVLNGVAETWTVGFLVDVILTRDVWMHRIDIAHATGRSMVLTADHDGVLVADVVAEWAERHGQPYTLHLDGPAGGSWARGEDGSELRLDAVEFCRILSGRARGDGLLTTEVPF